MRTHGPGQLTFAGSALPIWRGLFWFEAQTTCEAPQSFALTHIWEPSAAVARADSPPHARTKSAYTSIHSDGISTLARPVSTEEKWLPQRCAIVLFFFWRPCCGSWPSSSNPLRLGADLGGRAARFPTTTGVRKHTQQSSPSALPLFFFSPPSPSHPPLPIRLHWCLSAAASLTHLAAAVSAVCLQPD